MSEIILPISIGEALDKLTILDIKLDMIKDHRKNLVKIEYDLLYDKLKEYTIKYQFLYLIMKKINTEIWIEMDKLRDSSITDNDYIILCKKTIIDNDIRFRIKNKINNISNSSIKEQKGYNVINVYLNLNNFDINLHSIIIQYWSLRYDETIVLSNLNKELINKFSYDNTIKFILDEPNINTFNYTFNLELTDDINTLIKKINLSKDEINLYLC
jgi:hypothetical protein